MPKTNDAGGATYWGNQGIVEHGAPINDGRKFSELDPERELDGTLIKGEHPDHEDGEEREAVTTTDPRPLVRDFGDETDEDQARRNDREADAPKQDDTQNLEPVYSSSAKETAKPSDIKPARSTSAKK